MERRFTLSAIFLIFLSIFSQAFAAPAVNINYEAVSGSYEHKMKTRNELEVGIWIWESEPFLKSPELFSDFLQTASAKGVKQLYINGHPAITNRSNFKGFERLVLLAAERNIEVEILMGNHLWITSEDEQEVFLSSFLKSVADFWKLLPEGKKPGLHLDIEPHQLPEWSNGKDSLTQKTIALFTEVRKRLQNEGATIKISADIPYWFDDITTSDGYSVKEKLETIVDNVTLMVYVADSDTFNTIINSDNQRLIRSGAVSAIETDGDTLIGWDDSNNMIKGEKLDTAVSNIGKFQKRLAIHPATGINVFKVINNFRI